MRDYLFCEQSDDNHHCGCYSEGEECCYCGDWFGMPEKSSSESENSAIAQPEAKASHRDGVGRDGD
jgi:hypothetical protein